MIFLANSHLDHGLTDAQKAHILERFADRNAFFIETFELPEELGTVPCGLYGPTMGDDLNITEGGPPAFWYVRGTRKYASQCINRPMRPTRTVTVIAGPHGEHACVLYTAFGGPLAPKEPNDPTVGPEKMAESKAFWAVHALAIEGEG